MKKSTVSKIVVIKNMEYSNNNKKKLSHLATSVHSEGDKLIVNKLNSATSVHSEGDTLIVNKLNSATSVHSEGDKLIVNKLNSDRVMTEFIMSISKA